eukprot:CAMPEP_0178938020 /NCGR_PEP_ID=MMETSP0786-20121207/26099_1 /TAXON_ID=186022 /ORGANISM="Thalassionema frauenfeldii, Strain CCMP 1798" /LENGTH=44 /DNA_ID= /DNA_START= /DNA_END= /DNA_ORIENTATION=
MTIDDDVKVPKDLLNYFTTKYVHALTAFREKHPEVKIDAQREKG